MNYEELREMDDETLAKRIFEGAHGSEWFEMLRFETEKRMLLKAAAFMLRVDSSLGKTSDLLRQMQSSGERTERSTKRLEAATWAILGASLVIVVDLLLRLARR